MNIENKRMNISNIESKKTYRRASNIQVSESNARQILNDAVFTCTVFIKSIDIENRTFTGAVLPYRAKNVINNMVSSKDDLVSTKNIEYRGVGIIPFGINIEEVIPYKSIYICNAVDFDIKTVFSEALAVKNDPSLAYDTFENRMQQTQKYESEHNFKNLILIIKLIDL